MANNIRKQNPRDVRVGNVEPPSQTKTLAGLIVGFLAVVMLMGSVYAIVGGGQLEQDGDATDIHYTGFATFFVKDSGTFDLVNCTIDLYYYENGSSYLEGLDLNTTYQIQEKAIAVTNYSGQTNNHLFHNLSAFVHCSTSENIPQPNTYFVHRKAPGGAVALDIIKLGGVWGDFDESSFLANQNNTMVLQVNNTWYSDNASRFENYAVVPTDLLRGCALAQNLSWEGVWLALDGDIESISIEGTNKTLYSCGGYTIVYVVLGLFNSAIDLDITVETGVNAPSELFLYQGQISDMDDKVEV